MAVNSAEWWERWYATGHDSGGGSRGEVAEWKASVVNQALADHRVESVVEFGCGDGYQTSLYELPRYLGLDTSPTAVRIAQERFAGDPSKTVRRLDEWNGETGDATLSIDVIYHLLEDDVFEAHMEALFASAHRLVVVYSTNHEGPGSVTVRHRRFTDWTDANSDWKHSHIPNVFGAAEFYIFTP